MVKSGNRHSRLFVRRSARKAWWRSGGLSSPLASTSLHWSRAVRAYLGLRCDYPYEVRKEDEYFGDIPDEKIPKDMLDLASHIVETKSGHFNPEDFEDHYEDALKELLKKKQAGEKIEAPKE